ncbi:MAG: hypothetical protein PHU16_07510, partial [Atribacterota bacterium]|nr:hypothetical protein [Atribacterota bacterium]
MISSPRSFLKSVNSDEKNFALSLFFPIKGERIMVLHHPEVSLSEAVRICCPFPRFFNITVG